ncbi:MAG: flap endonuclease, partial [Brooklawnia sp.]
MRSVADSPTLIVDTASLYFRAYYGVSASLTDEAGHPVNAVHGLLDMLARLVQIYSPAALVCAWDDDWRPAWRVELVPSYKTHRLATPEVLAGAAAEAVTEGTEANLEIVEDDLARQVPWIVDCLTAAGLCVAGAPGFEADDVIGTLARRLA